MNWKQGETTVAELIKQLQKLRQDLPVFTCTGQDGFVPEVLGCNHYRQTDDQVWRVERSREDCDAPRDPTDIVAYLIN
jgi:predicted MPP superfamily phosphohydrolase